MPDKEPQPQMSSTISNKHRKWASLILLAMVCLSAPAQCQDGSAWDRARASLIASAPGIITPAIDRWRTLTGSENFGFAEYAGFVLAYPDFPDTEKLRKFAEKTLDKSPQDPTRLTAFFDRFPPLTNPARAQYALALAALSRGEASEMARNAWRGGTMSDASESALSDRFSHIFTTADHDARIDALLWDGNSAQASRMIDKISAAARPAAAASIALLQGGDATPITAENPLLSDAGLAYLAARKLYRGGNVSLAAQLLANRPPLPTPPLEPRKWVGLLLSVARDAGPSDAVSVAERIDDGFTPRTDIAQTSFAIRDDYTSLMWLGGTSALWNLRDPARAAPLFYRYGMAGRTPQTRAKGFYWAGRALAQSGQTPAATKYFESAAAYPDQFYGMLALERLGRPLPNLAAAAYPTPSAASRSAFLARPLSQAVRELAKNGDWPTTIRFFREISSAAKTDNDKVLVAELARNLGRRDLGVVLGTAAQNDGVSNFRDVAFPLIPTPEGANWTIIHAITRQESQFSQNAVSRTGARGLMQIMPAVGAERARKLGLTANTAALTSDAGYNLQIGNGHFAYLMDLYDGSYPLAIAAYNAGQGNVNKWLRSMGDPRQNEQRSSGQDWVEWIERLPFYETRGYVTHVIENAVVFESMNPSRASYKGADPASHFLGKKQPG